MKKTLLILTVLLVTAASSFGRDWSVIEFPTTETITGISLLSPDSFFVVTGSGKIARTLDGGKSWVANDFKADFSLNDVYFHDIFNGFICGSKGSIYKTSNGGENWKNISIQDTTLWVLEITIFDAEKYFVIGMKEVNKDITSHVYMTDDGGATWKEHESFGLGYSDIYYDSTQTLYVLSFGQLNYSKDHGKTWNSYKTGEGSPARAMSMFNKTILICGLNGMCKISDDGGIKWRQSQQTPGVVFDACQLISDEEGYIAGLNGIFLKTEDGGRKWEEVNPPKSFDILKFGYINGQLFAVGSQGGIITKKVK